jgi:hypothetical protein
MKQELIKPFFNLKEDLQPISKAFSIQLSPSNKETIQIITYTVIAVAIAGIAVYTYISEKETHG